MTCSSLGVPSGVEPGAGAIVELDAQEQLEQAGGQIEDVALAVELARMVDSLVFGDLGPGEVAAAVAARGAVLALARHVLTAAAAPPWPAGGSVVPEAVAALARSVAAHRDVPADLAPVAPGSGRGREWADLGAAARRALARRGCAPGPTGLARLGEIGHGVRLARLVAALDARLLTVVRSAPVVDLAVAAALGAGGSADLGAAAAQVEALAPTGAR